MILTADIGNTRTTLVAHAEDGPPPWDLRPRLVLRDRSQTLEADPERLLAWLRDLGAESEEAILVHASVAPRRAEELFALARASGVGRLVAAGSAACPLDVANLCREPDRVGRDRLLVASEARHRFEGGAAVAVDVGTAITVDAIDDTGGFRGGAIALGPGAAARALHSVTEALPVVEMRSVPEEPGRDTEAALRLAAFHGTGGLVDRLIEIVGRDLRSPRVLLCGGHAGVLSAALRTPHERERDVVHRALHRLWLRAQA